MWDSEIGCYLHEVKLRAIMPFLYVKLHSKSYFCTETLCETKFIVPGSIYAQVGGLIGERYLFTRK